MWDIMYMMENQYEIALIYHHLVALLFLFSNLEVNFIHKILLNAELSNFPTYIVYHKLHLEPPQACYFEKIIQLLVYFYFRIFIFTKLLFQHYENTFIKNNLLGIYLLGNYWFLNQVKKTKFIF